MDNSDFGLENDLFLRACLRLPTPRTPVWMMRQAGRYLPEYRAVREQAGDFLTLCKTPELAAEVTVQPVEILGVDAAILFSDILVIPEAMGQKLWFEQGEGPRLAPPVRSMADVEGLAQPDPARDLGYVLDTIRLVLARLDGRVPLIGFSGAPWTLATYMVEGGSSRDFRTIKRVLYEEPETLHALLARLADAVADYLNAQIAAGAHAVQIFDSWAGALAAEDLEDFSLAYIRRVVERLTRTREGAPVPVIVFAKGAMVHLEKIAVTGCDVVGLDWTISLAEARRRIGARTALQGNLDPAALYASPARIRELVARTLASFGKGHGHVFNLGHGITPDVPPEHARAMIEAVKELSPAYHAD